MVELWCGSRRGSCHGTGTRACTGVVVLWNKLLGELGWFQTAGQMDRGWFFDGNIGVNGGSSGGGCGVVLVMVVVMVVVSISLLQAAGRCRLLGFIACAGRFVAGAMSIPIPMSIIPSSTTSAASSTIFITMNHPFALGKHRGLCHPCTTMLIVIIVV